MTYFLDASSQLWYFIDESLKFVMKIDKIVDIDTTSDIDVLRDGVRYQIFNGEIEKTEQDGEHDTDILVAKFYDLDNGPDDYSYKSMSVKNGNYVVYLHDVNSDGDIICETDIDANEYVIFKISCKPEDDRDYDLDGHYNYKIYYLKKADIIMKIYVANYRHTVGYDDSWGNYTKGKIDKTSDLYHNYEYIIGGYVYCGDHLYSLLSGEQYEEIYPNIFSSIVCSRGYYYIDGICVDIGDFDLGGRTKSARKI